MGSSLAIAYTAAHYRVFADPPFVLHVGERSVELDALLTSHTADTWAFITACNPGSQLLPVDENTERMTRLRAVLNRFTIYSGEGVDPTGEWPGEPSVLVMGINRDEVVEVAKAFGQNAILAGVEGCAAELVWVESP